MYIYTYYKTVIVIVNKYLFSVPPQPLKRERECQYSGP